MQEFVLFALVLVAWIALNRWILPWLGIPTCMSCGCGCQPTSACATPASPPSDREEDEASKRVA